MGMTPETAAAEPGPNSTAMHLDKVLDEALEETFPASDPIAVHLERSEARPERDPTTLHHADRRSAGSIR